MTAVSLKKILRDANKNNYAVAGLVVLAWDDALAFTQAADETGVPIILQAGPSCRAHTPIPLLGKMFRDPDRRRRWKKKMRKTIPANRDRCSSRRPGLEGKFLRSAQT